jgi:FAD/FMN-containing dehydrogenase
MKFHVLTTQALLALGASALAVDTLNDCLRSASVPVASAAPTTYNLRLPYKPAAVAVPTTVAQISAAVSCGSKHGVRVTAKSGGHNYISSGYGGEDGHLVINLDRMYAVTVGSDGTAKVQSGARLGHVATELFNQGKRALSHGTCPGVGLGGHALHGGHGMVSRKYGLITDWIKGATVVMANGTVTHCSATERPNLFWAIRGAGSSMVIVAEFEFNTFAAPEQITYFDIDLTWNVAKVPQVLLDTQEFAKTMPAEMTLSFTFNNRGYFLHGAYVGSDSAFKSVIQPLLNKLGAKVSSSSTVGWMDSITHYAGTSSIDITTASYNEHENFYASSIVTPALSKSHFESFANAIVKTGFTTSRSWFMQMSIHGGQASAITKPKVNDTAYAHRDKMLLFQIHDNVPVSQPYPAEGITMLQDYRKSITDKLSAGEWGMYPNYPDSQIASSEAPKLYWGNNLRRLEWIKADYDPRNVIRFTQSIQPAQ